MKKIIIILTLAFMLSACTPVEQYTMIEPVIGFIPLENGNVEFATTTDYGRIHSTILELKNIYYYEGESKIIWCNYDTYTVVAYLSKEDYEELGRMRCEKWEVGTDENLPGK